VAGLPDAREQAFQRRPGTSVNVTAGKAGGKCLGD
jgi:hypothetical protein